MLSTAIPTLIAAIVIVIISKGIPIHPINPRTTPIERTFGNIAIRAMVIERNKKTNMIRNEKISQGKKVLLEIELEGARQVRENCDKSFQIFIAPPSFDELEQRIRGRGTDSENAIRLRLNRAKEEIIAKNEFDAVVINDDIEMALLEIEKLINLA